jgi:hypothetical protein
MYESAPELNALMTIFASTGPVISTRRHSSARHRRDLDRRRGCRPFPRSRAPAGVESPRAFVPA